MADKQESITDITPVMRASFVHLLKPSKMKGQTDEQAKYQITLTSPKGEKSHKEWRNKFRAQALAHWQENGGKGDLKRLKYPIIEDGDDPKHEARDAFHGHYLIKFSNSYKPKVINKAGDMLVTDDEVYSGMYCRVSYGFYLWNNEFGKGLTIKVFGVLKDKDGERFGGGPSVGDMFGDLIEGEGTGNAGEGEE